VTQAEYELLTQIEQGTSVFRPEEPGPRIEAGFSKTFEVLMVMRNQGWIQLPEGRISRDGQGRVLMAGPCDLTEAGRRALEQDRGLGPRP
jgi:hypothetical protein